MNAPKRSRPIPVYFRASEHEQVLIVRKMGQAGIRNKEAYLRKMAIDGFVIKLDLSDVRELVRLLRIVSNNMNRALVRAIAKPAWQPGSQTLRLGVIH